MRVDGNYDSARVTQKCMRVVESAREWVGVHESGWELLRAHEGGSL